MSVVLYTTGCPKCKVLETKLKQKGIEFEIVDDLDVMNKKGFMEVPKLVIDDKVMNFAEAMEWLK